MDNNNAFVLASNLSIADNLSNYVIKSASIDPLELYIEFLPPSKPQVTLNIVKEAQFIWSIATPVDNKEEIECIIDSSTQIIFVSIEAANSLSMTPKSF